MRNLPCIIRLYFEGYYLAESDDLPNYTGIYVAYAGRVQGETFTPRKISENQVQNRRALVAESRTIYLMTTKVGSNIY